MNFDVCAAFDNPLRNLGELPFLPTFREGLVYIPVMCKVWQADAVHVEIK